MNHHDTESVHDIVNTKVSVIVPIRNEEDSLTPLMKRLDAVFNTIQLPYEIIAIDDYSTDDSYNILLKLARDYPIKVFSKQGIIGRGASIQEGITQCSGDVIVQIDADLAYSPEAIPEILAKLKDADVVIGSRIYVNGERKVKKMFARVSNFLFGKVFFGLEFDVQSGLKAFKKEVTNIIELNTISWSFDLEFLLKAMHAGFTVVNHPIAYGSRKKGKGNMNLFQAGLELLLMSIRYRISPLDPVIFNRESTHKRTIHWRKKTYKPYTSLHLRNSAIHTVTNHQKVIMFILLAVVIAFFIINWEIALIAFVTIITLIYFADLIFNLYLIINSLQHKSIISVSEKETAQEIDWPMYSIMCPLYKEWEVIPQFVAAIDAMDYPKDKLQVQLILEEDDKKTQEEVKKMKLPSYVDVLITPHFEPKTKPKACNYALMHSKGEYIVIYDAEDVPDPMQLKKAVVAFNRMEDNVVCLQAKLNFYNIHQNVLTRLFTLEYSLWFDLVLTGLHSINAPIPLGGTSNHFKRKYLDLLQGWDPFNVTEDCDLGIRLFKYKYKTKILDSITLEEANSSFFGWFKQRSRWIKGYIQTYLVHMRRPHEFITDWSNPHLLTFQLIVGGKVLSMWINPILWTMTICYFLFRAQIGPFIESLYLTPIFYLAVLSLIVGNFLYFYYYMIGAAKKGYWDLIKYAFIIPGYWIMMSVSSLMALYQIIFAPHYWEKTKHGLHLAKKKISFT